MSVLKMLGPETTVKEAADELEEYERMGIHAVLDVQNYAILEG